MKLDSETCTPNTVYLCVCQYLLLNLGLKLVLNLMLSRHHVIIRTHPDPSQTILNSCLVPEFTAPLTNRKHTTSE